MIQENLACMLRPRKGRLDGQSQMIHDMVKCNSIGASPVCPLPAIVARMPRIRLQALKQTAQMRGRIEFDCSVVCRDVLAKGWCFPLVKRKVTARPRDGGRSPALRFG